MDTGNKCHWRVGTQIIDDESDDDSFYKKYWCNTPPSDDEETTTSTTTTSTTTTSTTTTTTTTPTTDPAADEQEVTPNLSRIPPGLVCQRHQQQQEEESRIIGGLEAVPNSWPWIVDITFGGAVCAGTIIDNKSILTAAHCCIIQRNNPERIEATIGQHNIFSSNAGQLTFNRKIKNL